MASLSCLNNGNRSPAGWNGAPRPSEPYTVNSIFCHLLSDFFRCYTVSPRLCCSQRLPIWGPQFLSQNAVARTLYWQSCIGRGYLSSETLCKSSKGNPWVLHLLIRFDSELMNLLSWLFLSIRFYRVTIQQSIPTGSRSHVTVLWYFYSSFPITRQTCLKCVIISLILIMVWMLTLVAPAAVLHG